MSNIASENFNGTSGTALQTHNASFSKITGVTGTIAINSDNVTASADGTVCAYTHSATPPDANYSVSISVSRVTAGGTGAIGVIGRSSTGAQTFYHARVNEGILQLLRYSAGSLVETLGATGGSVLANGETKTLTLTMDGDQISASLGATTLGPYTDTGIATAGKAGIRGTSGSAQILLDDWTADTLGGGDTTAPVLSSPTGTATGSTTATVGATTDEGNGTLYAFVSTSATPPSDADLIAGTGATWAGSVAVGSTGAKTLNAVGLTASTGYYAHLLHRDAAANDSNIVTSALFTTSAPGVTPPVHMRAFPRAILNH
jgi:hypothetical protein